MTELRAIFFFHFKSIPLYIKCTECASYRIIKKIEVRFLTGILQHDVERLQATDSAKLTAPMPRNSHLVKSQIYTLDTEERGGRDRNAKNCSCHGNSSIAHPVS